MHRISTRASTQSGAVLFQLGHKEEIVPQSVNESNTTSKKRNLQSSDEPSEQSPPPKKSKPNSKGPQPLPPLTSFNQSSQNMDLMDPRNLMLSVAASPESQPFSLFRKLSVTGTPKLPGRSLNYGFSPYALSPIGLSPADTEPIPVPPTPNFTRSWSDEIAQETAKKMFQEKANPENVLTYPLSLPYPGSPFAQSPPALFVSDTQLSLGLSPPALFVSDTKLSLGPSPLYKTSA